MTTEDIQTSIDSYKARLKERKAELVTFVMRDELWNAQIALGECIGFEACVKELEFQLMVMEVENG